MNLSASRYIGAEYEHRDIKGTIDLTEHGIPIDIPFKKLQSIKISVGYWRKANAIHKWFVDNVQDGDDDCGEYYVHRSQLEELKALCLKVLSVAKIGKKTEVVSYLDDGKILNKVDDVQTILNSEEIEDILPTQSGFFFGSTGYDEDYIEDIQKTLKIIDEALLLDDSWDFYYSSSW